MEHLQGGRAQIARSGDVVHRPAGPWSNSVHLLLQYVREHGFTGAPEPVGFDDAGNEVLTFLPGEVSNYPLSDTAASQAALESAARLLRAFHDASASFLNSETKQLPWMLPNVEPTEVICHGDYAPYNVVLNGGKATGIIDFDTAHPGSRAWDIAYALYRWAPLNNPTNPDSLGDLDDQIDRAKNFCDTYGLPRHDRREIITVAILRLKTLVDFMRNEAAKDNATFAAHLAAGHHLGYLNDIAYLQEHQTQIVHGLL